MFKHKEDKKLPPILYSCYSKKNSEGEHFIPEHVFGYTFSGSSEIFVGGKTVIFKGGDFRFFRRNQLARYTKFPPPGGEYRSISIFMDQETLHSISEEHNLHMERPYTGENSLHLTSNHFFTNYIDSLTPYLNGSNDFNKALTVLKVKEAIMLLLETNPALKNLLFDF